MKPPIVGTRIPVTTVVGIVGMCTPPDGIDGIDGPPAYTVDGCATTGADGTTDGPVYTAGGATALPSTTPRCTYAGEGTCAPEGMYPARGAHPGDAHAPQAAGATGADVTEGGADTERSNTAGAGIGIATRAGGGIGTRSAA